jgi:natural product precursor
MKKRELRKLTLNKETIASLNRMEMNDALGGSRPSRIGVSCYTGHCCYSKIECETEEIIKKTKNC